MPGAYVPPRRVLGLTALTENTILSTGPHGEPPTAATDLGPSSSERKRRRARAADAPIVAQIRTDEW